MGAHCFFSIAAQYAGNVVVYGACHPADGDWFGGINVANAEEFLEALASMEASFSSGVCIYKVLNVCSVCVCVRPPF